MNNPLLTLLLGLLCQTALAQNEQPVEESNSAPAQSQQTQHDPENFNPDMAVAFGEKSAERQASETAFAAWSSALNQYLLASGDAFTQATTLAMMLSGIQNAETWAKMHDQQQQVDALNDISYQPLADLLNQWVAKPDLSAETFDILTGICFNPKMQDHCHANVLFENRMEHDTANLQAYLRPFEVAVKANNQQSMLVLIQLMAASEYSKKPLGISEKMASLIDEFIANNPIPQSAIDNMISDYQKLSGISPEKKAQLSELMPGYMPIFIKLSFNHLNDAPPYKTVLDYCQSNLAALQSCRDISEIMIQNSNSMIDKGVGHSLLIASFELERNQVGIEAAQQLNQKFRQTYECLRDLSKDKYFIDSYFNPAYQKITFSSTDEFATLIQLAELRFQNLTAQGDETAVNPDSCFNESQQLQPEKP